MGLSLTPDMMLVLGLVLFTMLMLVLEWIRADMVALLVVVVIGLTGLIPADRVFNGFAGNAVIAIIAIMIMGEGLDRAGVLNAGEGPGERVRAKRTGGVYAKDGCRAPPAPSPACRHPLPEGEGFHPEPFALPSHREP